MTTPKLSVDTPRGRMYRLEPDGPAVYPSITTVSGTRSKAFLQRWYGTMAARRALDMFDFLDRNPTRATGEIRRVLSDRRGSTAKIAAAASDHSGRAADFGTLVHAACEKWERDSVRPDQAAVTELIDEMRADGCFGAERNLQQLVSQVDARLDGFEGFLRDFGPEFVEVEQTVVNHSEKYAGTTDCLVRIGGALLSGDIKTSKSVHGDYALQGVAVCNAEALLDDDGGQREMPEVTGAFIIHLPAEGGYRIVPLRTGDSEWAAFRALRTAWGYVEDQSLLAPAANPKTLLLELLKTKGDFDFPA